MISKSVQLLVRRSMTRARLLGTCAGGLALVFGILILGGQTYRADGYRAQSPDAHRLRDAKCIIHLFETDQIRKDSIFLKAQRPKDTCCMITVFAFNPAYTSIRVNSLSVDLNGTNVASLTKPSTVDTNDLVFKPYIDKDSFRAEFPNQDPREALFAFFPDSATAPLLTLAPEVGSKMRVQVGLEIISRDGTVLSTNMLTDFRLVREENRHTWAEMLFARLFMPRF